MALEAEAGHLFLEGLFRLLFAVGRDMAGRAALLHADELGDGLVDDALADERFVAFQTGLIRCRREDRRCTDEEQQGERQKKHDNISERAGRAR
jgi:hypothetical protein